MKKDKRSSPAFNDAAAPEAGKAFVSVLTSKFGGDEATVNGVLDVMNKLGLPLPENHYEFLTGTEGALLFLTQYGVVLRIERHEHSGDDDYFGLYEASDFSFDRVDSSPWVLKPIATLTAGKAVIEICPGCRPESDINASRDLKGKLRDEGIYFWDEGVRNIGRLPVKTPSFPKGVPVVVDRLAVRNLTGDIHPVAKALNDVMGITRREEEKRREAAAAEEKLYGPLRKCFAAVETGEKTMKDFWRLCEDYARQGKLVAGWDQNSAWSFASSKGTLAKMAAKTYAERMGL